MHAIVVHGGAGTIDRSRMTSGDEADYRCALADALEAGHLLLEGGASALEAVVAAVVVLEDSPLFNAGRGSVLNREGEVEMDAAVMDGSTRRAGAVAAVRRVRNPVLAARRVLSDTDHVLLAGPEADRFAAERGLAMEEPEYFRTRGREAEVERARRRGSVPIDPGLPRGTVGAVALDIRGNLAAATSTGGMTAKLPGRVGDTPLIGAGTWARSETCAVSCTGHGEYLILTAAAHSVSARMEWAGQTLEEAAESVVRAQLGPAGGKGGLIALDRAGTVAMPYNSAGMYRGYRRPGSPPVIRIWEE